MPSFKLPYRESHSNRKSKQQSPIRRQLLSQKQTGKVSRLSYRYMSLVPSLSPTWHLPWQELRVLRVFWDSPKYRKVTAKSTSWYRNYGYVITQLQTTWWRHQMETFSALLALCEGNSPVPVNSPHKGQWRGALMFSLICGGINNWVNNREAGDLRRHRGRYDVIVMKCLPVGIGFK